MKASAALVFAGWFACSTLTQAADAMPRMQLSLSLGPAPAPLALSAGFSHLPLGDEDESRRYLPLSELRLMRGGAMQASVLGQRLDAAAQPRERSNGWLWWTIAGVAVTALVVVAAAGSDKDETTTTNNRRVCGDNDVVIGNGCVGDR